MGRIRSITRYIIDVQKLHTIRNSVTIPASTTKYFNLPIPSNYRKYDLRAVYAKNITNSNEIVIKIGETDKDANIRYVSLQEAMINDILTFPFEDINDTGFIHLWISNTGTGSIIVDYELRIYDLK